MDLLRKKKTKKQIPEEEETNEIAQYQKPDSVIVSDRLKSYYKLFEEYLMNSAPSGSYLGFSLREKAKKRLLVEMFEQIKTKKAKLSSDYIILVVDKHTSHLVS